VYEIFSIERRFQRFKSDFLGSRKPAHEGIKLRYPRKSRDKMPGDRLTVCEQFAHLVSISPNFLLIKNKNATLKIEQNIERHFKKLRT